MQYKSKNNIKIYCVCDTLRNKAGQIIVKYCKMYNIVDVINNSYGYTVYIF